MKKELIKGHRARFTFDDDRHDPEVLHGVVVEVRDQWENGRRYITELCIKAPDDRPIDNKLLRAIPLSKLLLDINTALGLDTAKTLTAGQLRKAITNRDAAGYGDDFYQMIARRYLVLVASGVHGPAASIASDNDVPTTSVHRWLKEARARGFLHPGRRGAAG